MTMPFAVWENGISWLECEYWWLHEMNENRKKKSQSLSEDGNDQSHFVKVGQLADPESDRQIERAWKRHQTW
jgi:hypothetical protein